MSVAVTDAWGMTNTKTGSPFTNFSFSLIFLFSLFPLSTSTQFHAMFQAMFQAMDPVFPHCGKSRSFWVKFGNTTQREIERLHASLPNGTLCAIWHYMHKLAYLSRTFNGNRFCSDNQDDLLDIWQYIAKLWTVECLRKRKEKRKKEFLCSDDSSNSILPHREAPQSPLKTSSTFSMSSTLHNTIGNARHFVEPSIIDTLNCL